MTRFLKAFFVVLLTAGIVSAAGHYAPNGYRYLYQLTTQGTTDYAQIVASETATDAWMANRKVLGDPGYNTLAAAIAAIGSTNTKLVVPSTLGPVAVPAGLTTTIPANVQLEVDNGAYFIVPNSSSLVIQGPIDAGPYQIFSWTGTGAINLTASPTKSCYFQWWGPTSGTVTSGTDISPYLLKAYQSLTDLNAASNANQHEIVLTGGFWWLNSNMTFVPPGGWTGGGADYFPPHLVGDDDAGTAIVMNVGSTTDGICMGGLFNGNSQWIFGAWIKNLCILGAPNSCRHALNLQCWNNRGGVKDVSLQCGSSDSAVLLSSVENCTWDIKLGPTGTRYTQGSAVGLFSPMYAGVQCAPTAGVGFPEGAGTYNYFRVHKTFIAGGVYALKLDTCNAVAVVDDCDFEATSGGEVQSYYGYGGPIIQLYSGGITKIGNTFTLAAPTEIDNIGFTLNRGGSNGIPHGKVTANIYATSGGAPTGAPLYTSWQTINAPDLNQGNAFYYTFQTAKQTLAAGTYYADVEFSGGDANNWVGVQVNTPVGAGTCYTYSGSSYTPQAYTPTNAVNARGAIWLVNSGSIQVRSQHMESNWVDYLIDNCRNIDISNAGGSPQAIVTRSSNVTLNGSNSYESIQSDPISNIILGSNAFGGTGRPGLNYNYGDTMFMGALSTPYDGAPLNINGNSPTNLMPNTLFDRWQTSMPDGGWNKSGTMTWVKCGTGLSDTTRHPLTPFCARLRETATGYDNLLPFAWSGEMLNMCKGRWLTVSAYMMFPSSQTFVLQQLLGTPNYTVPTWGSNTAYNVGDAVNGGSTVCVQPGTSGSGSQPSWSGSSGAPTYMVDGTVVWVTCNPWSTLSIDSSYSDGIWRRFSQTFYVPTNATVAGPNWLWNGQASTYSTAYFALPMVNFGRNPGQAPAPIALLPITQTQVVGNSHFDSDAYIPSDGTNSKLKGLPACVGDRCKNDGTVTALTTGNVETWGCTVAGINGSGSTWAIVTKVP